MFGVSKRRIAVRIAVLTALAFALIPASSAFAGRLLVTGHDADLHCSGNSQCHFVEVATRYVRGGAPDPSKPVLVLDRLDLDFVRALDNAFGAGAVPRVVMDPRSAQFASAPLRTDLYSAILIASDITCGGCDLNEFNSTPDSDAINARKDDIARFFNAGGGVYANAGAQHGDGSAADDTFYRFAPIPIGGLVVQPPFCLTPDGAALGLEDPSGCPDPSKRRGTRDDINCCPTHNSFTNPPAGTALRVAERDTGADGVVSGDDQVETMFAAGIISGGAIISEPPAGANGDNAAASARRPCDGRLATIVDLTGDANIVGTPGDDVIVTGAGNDVVDGKGGNDRICTGRGTDRVKGGTGNDRIFLGFGNDSANGDSGNDRIRGSRGNDRLKGARGRDRMRSDSGNDRAAGGSGNDRVIGDAGNDRVSGDAGNDIVGGTKGKDRVNGGNGNDRVGGNSGNDRINGGRGRDRANGGSGNDIISLTDRSRDFVNCSTGRDRVARDSNDKISLFCETIRLV